MKANQIWMGHEYAYVDGGYRRSAGNPLPMKASRCTPVKIYEELIGQRARTMVRVKFPDNPENWYGDSTDKDVPARHLIDFWDNYEDERNHILELRKEAQAKRQAELAEMEAARVARRARDTQLITDLSELMGIHRTYIGINGNRIEVDKEKMREWLDSQAKTSDNLDAIHLPGLH